MRADLIEREWELIARLLPSDWRELARSTGALERARHVRTPDSLLRLIFLYAASGLSLQQASARATLSGLARISDVGVLKRIRKAGPWLRALAERMFASRPLSCSLDAVVSERRLLAVDATHVRGPGSRGTNWRIHYVLRLPSLECDFFELTDHTGGESYTRVPVSPGDIILGDRGYCHRDGVAHVIDHGGDVLVRLNANSFPLLKEDGTELDLLATLRTTDHEPRCWSVSFDARGRRYQARLCAVRKSAEAAERSKRRLTKTSRKKGKRVRPETLELAEYVFVLTTPGLRSLSAADVLELYRARWQVELAFKRMKSLFGAGEVPSKDPDSARSWIYAKLLAVLLIERLGEEARLFSPWGFPLRTGEPLARVQGGMRFVPHSRRTFVPS
jgi:hypothetical protein